MEKAPRIYNFFPKIVGSIDLWNEHLDRIKNMNFNWLYVNPLNFTGFSGSLYSIKDFYKFNPIFAPENSENPHSWEPFKNYVSYCHENGLKLMYDLVINHTSIDSPLIDEHPEWFIEKWAIIHKKTLSPVKFFPIDDPTKLPEIDPDQYPEERFSLEKRISSPFAIDPADADKITIWGDLAEINNLDNSDLNGLTGYWLNLIDFYLELGIDGFRCDAAYQIPPDMWKTIIEHAKEINPKVIFVAETLGCTLKQMADTCEAGFDYINNSSKWWDYTEPWALEQYEEFRKFAPSIGFPESHDTIRLANETKGQEEVQKFKYFFASFFSAGVMMPIGYEYGFKTKIDVVKMTPDAWESPNFDISAYIKKINQLKTSNKCLNEDGPMKQYNYKDSNILIMKKTSIDEKQQILMIYNKDWHNSHDVTIQDLQRFLGLDKTIYTLNVDRVQKIYKSIEFSKILAPNECFMFIQE